MEPVRKLFSGEKLLRLGCAQRPTDNDSDDARWYRGSVFKIREAYARLTRIAPGSQ